MQIVNLFYNLAREHKRLRSFVYGKAYRKGAGNSVYPLMWMDDPVYGRLNNNTVQYTVNIDLLGVPASEANIPGVQAAAFEAGLTIAEKIKQIRANTGFALDGFTFLSLSDYYDDNAAGYRFTYTLTQANPVDRCNDDFDPDKRFEHKEALPDFNVDNPDGCAVFNDKPGLPNFKITDPQGCVLFTDDEQRERTTGD